MPKWTQSGRNLFDSYADGLGQQCLSHPKWNLPGAIVPAFCCAREARVKTRAAAALDQVPPERWAVAVLYVVLFNPHNNCA